VALGQQASACHIMAFISHLSHLCLHNTVHSLLPDHKREPSNPSHDHLISGVLVSTWPLANRPVYVVFQLSLDTYHICALIYRGSCPRSVCRVPAFIAHLSHLCPHDTVRPTGVEILCLAHAAFGRVKILFQSHQQPANTRLFLSDRSSVVFISCRDNVYD